MRSKEQLAREKLSPFLETAFSQLLSELPQTRRGYELVKRIEARVRERRIAIYRRKSQPSKGRRRSQKDIEARKLRFEQIKAERRGEHSSEISRADASYCAPAPFTSLSQPLKTQAQLDYEANLRVSREVGIERGEAGWDD